MMMAFRTLCVVFLLLAKVCGKANLNNRIVGGQDAVPGSWPWQVSLQACGSHFCGGSLINNGWVLSSAHCFGSYMASQVTVKLGLYTLEGYNAYRESRWLANVIIHPDYKKEQYDNDIALLQLSSVVTFNDYITPVCLAETGSTFHNGTMTWVTGWGKICDKGVVCGSVKRNYISSQACSPLALAGTWPWMASLQLNGTHVCGGTLIAQRFVMSSADCFSSSSNPSDWTVKLGRLNQNGSNPNEVSVNVTNITFSTSAGNNIVVLKLSTTPTLSDFIQPICVDFGNTNFNIGTQCWAAGWGSGGGAQQTLQQFHTTIEDCGNVSSSNSICIDPIPLEQTQRGGPLMCQIGETWIQAAVLTFTSNSMNSTTNSTNSSDVSPSSTNIQAFTTISSFSAFLNFTLSSALSISPYITPVSVAAAGSTIKNGILTWVIGWGNIRVGAVVCGYVKSKNFSGAGSPLASAGVQITTIADTGCHSQLNVCGIANRNTRIVGGLDADPGAWPWQVSLQAYGSHFCGGSLINNGWVLSAAHCFGSYIASQVTVKLGLYTLEGNNAYRQSRWLSNVIIHPDYKKGKFHNDLALLQLSSVVSINDYITPVCLAETGSTFHSGTLTWVTGWGKIGDEVNLPSPGILQEVPVQIIGNKQCYCLYGGFKFSFYFENITNTLCAGLLEGGRDACQGDSGGPLVIRQGFQWIQVGIVSFGEVCAHPNAPGVYTRVSQYQNWIIQEITTNQPGFIKYTSCGIDDDLQVTCTGLPSAIVCGSAQLNTLSGTGSTLASAGTWPWMASLQLNGIHICGGTLIAQQFVMSSADCFSSSSNPSDWTVKLGRLNPNGLNPNEVSVNVTNISFSTSGNNNIAVLKLATTPTLSDFIQPICVDFGNTNFSISTQCWVAGWGSGGGAQQTLQQLNTTIVDCGNVSSSNSICIKAIPLEQGGTQSLMGDSGGPLVIKQGNQWIQAGIVSFGFGCALPFFPGVYTRVSQYQDWINAIITTNQPGFVTYNTSNGTDSDQQMTCNVSPFFHIPIQPPVVCGSAKRNNVSEADSSLASAGTWPWMASLHLNGTHICGGTLIAQRFVMSSADCFSSSNKSSDWSVKLGWLDQTDSNSNGVSVCVSNISFGTSASNNIAVLKLATTPNLTDFIQPICVDFGKNSFSIGTQCWVAGWGSGGGAQQTLQQITTTIVDCGNASPSNSICIKAIQLDE
ncbi:transmembrane protease serine 9-like, partial [Clarias magur]